MFERGQLFLVPFALTLEFLGNFLLENQSFESVVTLLLGTSKTSSEACGIVLLLVDKTGETSVLALVSLNLDLELRCLLGKLFGECLEFEKLDC